MNNIATMCDDVIKLRMAELVEVAKDWGCSIYEVAYEELYSFYVAAGFSCEPLQAELDTLKPEELIEAYLKL